MGEAIPHKAIAGPPICTFCLWPIEVWHPAAMDAGRMVHAVCLDQVVPRHSDGFSTADDAGARKPAARVGPRPQP